MSALAADLEAAAGFGTGGPGVTRVAWSPELRSAYDWLAGRLAEVGAVVEIDTAGNLVGRLGPEEGGAVVVGSHLDTVAHGGRYDGTLGVLAGLHALRL